MMSKIKHIPYQKTLVLGSGALKIGEAGEFDYSGSQALKALREESIETVLINPNIATIQTSPSIADHIYLLPIKTSFVEKVIQKEKPDSILVTFGGQTALNCGVDLYQKGIFEKYNITVLGTPIDAIVKTEDRDIFKQELKKIGIKTAKSVAIETLQQAQAAAAEIGFPIIIRSAYALGGLGSGFASNIDEFIPLVEKALSLSPQILIEESLKGWKEIEYEIVRDYAGNCMTVCNMENFDPIGIHTGESIVVAPSQTLSNKEYHLLRKLSTKIIQHFGIIGECNAQFALDPKSEDYRIIEVNARLSRSSALASKATGYPLAHIAGKLALGYRLDELKNNITKITSAFFEPALDYCVIKIPRWDLGKFYGVDREIGSSMKSVGEVMSIGKTFEEAIQKGIRMLDIGMNGFVSNETPPIDISKLNDILQRPTDQRIFTLAYAMQHNYTVSELHQLTRIDHWFLDKLYTIHRYYIELQEKINTISDLNTVTLLKAKQMGFSDTQLAFLIQTKDSNIEKVANDIRNYRIKLGVQPYVKQIDTLAAEFPAKTNYLYLTYHGSEHDISPSTIPNQNSVIVLGSGAYRIGSSVEFDWCCVTTIETIHKEGLQSVIINCNPETVSTDYDISDKLYFEELSLERVRDIYDFEQSQGIIVSVGGQAPNNLALKLKQHRIPLLGTDANEIDRVENRHLFSKTLDKINVEQPLWKEFSSLDDMNNFVNKIGFPVLIRPSYVLSGAAMSVVSNKEELKNFLHVAKQVSKKYPIVVTQFIENAREIEIDAVAQKGNLIAYEISEHIENAGVHSGDATLCFPCVHLTSNEKEKVTYITTRLSKEFNITGPFNIQFLSKDNKVKVIELNLRASRSVPFISKVSGRNLIQLASEAQLGKPLTPKLRKPIQHFGIKSPQFSFTRLKGADPILGVEMASTGEVGCIAHQSDIALLESMLSVGYTIPKKRILISSGPVFAKVELLGVVEQLAKRSYQIYATAGTHLFFKEHHIKTDLLSWPNELSQPNVLDVLKQKRIELVINIPKNNTRSELDNDYAIRRLTTDLGIPLITNIQLAASFIKAFLHYDVSDIEATSLQDFFN